MHDGDGYWSACGSVSNVCNPIQLASEIIQQRRNGLTLGRVPPMLLSSNGAYQFAVDNHLKVNNNIKQQNRNHSNNNNNANANDNNCECELGYHVTQSNFDRWQAYKSQIAQADKKHARRIEKRNQSNKRSFLQDDDENDDNSISHTKRMKSDGQKDVSSNDDNNEADTIDFDIENADSNENVDSNHNAVNNKDEVKLNENVTLISCTISLLAVSCAFGKICFFCVNIYIQQNSTVGCIAIDSSGFICSGVSSGGVWMKQPGRVGHVTL